MAKISKKKYKNIILFFASKVRNGTLGKLKMMKLLYFLDFDFFEKYGKSVSGDEYLRFENGPVPRHAEKFLRKLVESKAIKMTRKPVGVGYNDKQLIEPLEEFDLNEFSKEELLMMEEIADKWQNHSGSEMKSASHGEAPWIATKPDEVIDYNLSYYRNKYGELNSVE